MDFGYFNPYGFNNSQSVPVWPPMNGYAQPQKIPPQSQQMGMEVIPVTTISQVEQVSLQPGQRKLVMVQNEPVIASRYADNMGLITTEYYRLEKFVPGAAPTQGDYVTRLEFEQFVASLTSNQSGKEEAKK